MTVEDGLVLRRISEAADRSYQVAPEPSRLSLRMKSFAVVFEVFQGFARESPFLRHLRRRRTTRYCLACWRPPAPRSARRLGAGVRSERRHMRPRQHPMRQPGGQQRQPAPRRLPAAGRPRAAAALPSARRGRSWWSPWVAPPCLSRPRPRRGKSPRAFCR